MNFFTEELFTENKIDYDLPGAEIEYFPEFFSRKKSLFFLSKLIDTIKWKQNIIKMLTTFFNVQEIYVDTLY